MCYFLVVIVIAEKCQTDYVEKEEVDGDDVKR